MKSVVVNLFIVIVATIVVGCAAIVEGPSQKVFVHCSPPDGIEVSVNGANLYMENGVLELGKDRDAHFVTFSKKGYAPNTISFNREVEPLWPDANLIWGPACPLGWLLDWGTNSVYRIDPQDIHVVLRKFDNGDES